MCVSRFSANIKSLDILIFVLHADDTEVTKGDYYKSCRTVCTSVILLLKWYLYYGPISIVKTSHVRSISVLWIRQQGSFELWPKQFHYFHFPSSFISANFPCEYLQYCCIIGFCYCFELWHNDVSMIQYPSY